MTTRILVGDVRERLADLPDASVHCVITSPPYFGLRDYGTADWTGGDPECDHARPAPSPASFASSTLQSNKKSPEKSAGTQALINHQQEARYPHTCAKCGAVRVDNQIGLEGTLDCGRRGMYRLRSDLTEDQREYVVRRLLGADIASSGCDTDGRAPDHSTVRSGGRDVPPTT
jgi:hypothetical protein